MPSFLAFRSPTPFRGALAAAALVTLALLSPAYAADDSEPLDSVMTRLRVQEAPQPIRADPQWPHHCCERHGRRSCRLR
jgi:hypothetical protein